MRTHSDLYEQEDENPQLSYGVSLPLAAMTLLAVGFSAECLIDSIEGTVKSSELSKTFVGLILIPIVGNAAEVTTVTFFNNFF